MLYNSYFIDHKNKQEVSISQRTFKYTKKVWKASELVYEQTGCESLISIEQEKQRLKQVYNTNSVFADITYS
ncbi:hypothetical protein HMPREF9714_02207 [Myroides odoratimimus CCUG 12901]|uniref:Uncharacterized protein n=2 Tax=Myroides odoratimimus TaxID=76832 RepID=A0A0U2WPM5_9FLAO|nr:hypothetical protein AS202_18415 [Myroides odoratimimus]APA93666.1 hypothetical protein BK054_15825 [Myroides sp. ZB35]EHO08184.1 hypothetical protein HMPREF9714_02207 [Myroides odoratimimus CCUG 12901]EHO10240.1 hypothetical protein HMPREF9712_01345 [Myroides odoratimimus CCUG 10230]EKB05992.1 hypothetical protein HMPREF9711_00961 [Myroides odoratimimus CCUG 3837]EPH13352.1 hypothetical protein HMPREF9713_00681 [Myroides odoratimimus CCUG 12700]